MRSTGQAHSRSPHLAGNGNFDGALDDAPGRHVDQMLDAIRESRPVSQAQTAPHSCGGLVRDAIQQGSRSSRHRFVGAPRRHTLSPSGVTRGRSSFLGGWHCPPLFRDLPRPQKTTRPATAAMPMLPAVFGDCVNDWKTSRRRQAGLPTSSAPVSTGGSISRCTGDPTKGLGFHTESGRRGSNPRPSAWEAREVRLNHGVYGLCSPQNSPVCSRDWAGVR